MRRTLIFSMLAAAAIGLSFGSASAQRSAKGKPVAKPLVYSCIQRFGAADWNLLLAGLKSNKPDSYDRFMSDPELRSNQVKDLRELFALGCQAVKDGRLNDPVISGELVSIRNEIVAVEFEKIANKAPGKAALESVSGERVAGFYKVPGNEAKFNEFLKLKLELFARSGSGKQNLAPTDAEKAEARQVYAKVLLLDGDSNLKATKLEPAFFTRVGLQVKLQQTQFMASLAAEANAAAMTVSDSEVDGYIQQHPELSSAAKRAKAEGILARAKAGEDFAKLADENSDDPGNIAENGKKNGGLYADVSAGTMLPAFEKTALALEPGTVSPVLTETDFGYHIIKLEKRSGTAAAGDLKYDVRHVLISTGVKDPSNPNGVDVPVKEYVRNVLEGEKEAVVMAKIVKDNPVAIADVPVAPATPAKPRPGTRKPGN